MSGENDCSTPVRWRKEKYKRGGEVLNHALNRGGVLLMINNGINSSDLLLQKAEKSESSIKRDLRLLDESNFIKYESRIELTPAGKVACKLKRVADTVGNSQQIVNKLPNKYRFD